VRKVSFFRGALAKEFDCNGIVAFITLKEEGEFLSLILKLLYAVLAKGEVRVAGVNFVRLTDSASCFNGLMIIF
jgi:hypothetical protein